VKVTELLKKAAAKTGFIKVVDETKPPEPDHKPLRTKQILLKDLIQEAAKKDPAGEPAELTLDIGRIFDGVKLTAYKHGWNADKVLSFLDSEPLRSKSPEEANKALIEELAKNQVPAEDILKDVLARDQALDSYEKYAYKKQQERAQDRKREIARLEQQIKECEQKIDALKTMEREDSKSFSQWLQRKIAKEQELVRVASQLTANHGVSVGSVTEEKHQDKSESRS
jgi:hypothetical protein